MREAHVCSTHSTLVGERVRKLVGHRLLRYIAHRPAHRRASPAVDALNLRDKALVDPEDLVRIVAAVLDEGQNVRDRDRRDARIEAEDDLAKGRRRAVLHLQDNALHTQQRVVRSLQQLRRRAEAARQRALVLHERWIFLALATVSPRPTRRVAIFACLGQRRVSD